jgi:hypothetical protein
MEYDEKIYKQDGREDKWTNWHRKWTAPAWQPLEDALEPG